MAGFEAPISHPELARRLQEIDAMSLRIARSALMLGNLEHFIESCVEPNLLTDGDQVFNYGYFSGIAPSGTMIHVRSNAGKADGRPADPEHQFAVVTGSIFDHDVYVYGTTTFKREHLHDGSNSLDILLGVPQEAESPVLQLIGGDVTTTAEWLASEQLLESELERYLAADEATNRLASVHNNSNKWEFRHGDGGREHLRGLMSVRAEVELATKRGLAGTALRNAQDSGNREEYPGHIVEKVVV